MSKRRIGHANEDEFSFVSISRTTAKAFCRVMPGWIAVLWAIIILTYEDYKMQGQISLAQLKELTGLTHVRIWELLQDLEAKNMITRTDVPGKPSVIRFQQDTKKWVYNKQSKNYLNRLQKAQERYKNKVIKLNAEDINTNG